MLLYDISRIKCVSLHIYQASGQVMLLMTLLIKSITDIKALREYWSVYIELLATLNKEAEVLKKTIHPGLKTEFLIVSKIVLID